MSDPAGTTRDYEMARTTTRGRHSIGVAFSQITCRCGAKRVRGVACPDCARGADWFEVDVDVQRRVRIATACLKALEAAATPDTGMARPQHPAERLDHFGELAGLPTAFLETLQRLSEPGHDNPDDLVEICSTALHLARTLSLRDRHRPWIRTDDTAQMAAEALLDMMRAYLAAFAAPTPLSAQSYAVTAQQALDTAAAQVGELNQLRQRWESIAEGDDLGLWMAEALADAAQERQTTGFVELDLAGRELYRDITGRMPGEGAGLGLLVSDLFAQYVGDEEAFKKAIATADQFLSSRTHDFHEAIARPTVAEELRNGFLQLADQLQATNSAIAAALNDRQAVRAALALMHTIFEGPARRMVALLLELAGKRRFEQYLPADGAQTISAAQDVPAIRATVYGFDRALRIAQAHHSYEVVGDSLILRQKRAGEPEGVIVYISLNDLLDRALAAIECVTALALAIQVHASEAGVDLMGPEVLEAWGAGSQQQGTALLCAAGYDQVEFDGADVSMSGPPMTGEAAVAVSLALPDEQIATVVLHTDGVRTHYQIDIGLLRGLSTIPEGLQKELHAQRILKEVLINGEPSWPEPSMQQWVAGRAVQIMQSESSPREEFPRIMREMRQLLNFTIEQSLPIAQEIRDLVRYLRLTFEGRISELDVSVFDRLGQYARDDTRTNLPFALNASGLVHP